MGKKCQIKNRLFHTHCIFRSACEIRPVKRCVKKDEPGTSKRTTKLCEVGANAFGSKDWKGPGKTQRGRGDMQRRLCGVGRASRANADYRGDRHGLFVEFQQKLIGRESKSGERVCVWELSFCGCVVRISKDGMLLRNWGRSTGERGDKLYRRKRRKSSSYLKAPDGRIFFLFFSTGLLKKEGRPCGLARLTVSVLNCRIDQNWSDSKRGDASRFRPWEPSLIHSFYATRYME